MVSSAWLTPLLVAQLAAPPTDSRPLDPGVPRAIAHPSSKQPPPPRPVVAEPAKPPPPSAVRDTATAPRGTRCFPARARCRQLAVPGVIATVVGLSAMGGGAAMIAVGKPPLSDEPASLRDFQTPGIVTAAVGTATLITGIVLIVYGKRAHRKAQGAATR